MEPDKLPASTDRSFKLTLVRAAKTRKPPFRDPLGVPNFGRTFMWLRLTESFRRRR
jgi:hypothetical protein